MATSHDPSHQSGPLSRACQLQNQDEKFSFTPVKAAAAPRLWDRKPSNAFLGRSKSRKVWKRFRSSFNSMKALQRLVTASHEDVDEDLFAEINLSRNLGFVRGVKRRCFGLEDESQPDRAVLRGRSFLETKWESEATGRRRKLPTNHADFNDSQAEPMDMDEEEEGGHAAADEDEPRDAATSIAEQDTDASFDSTPDTLTDSALFSANLHALHGKSVIADDCAGNNYDFEINATGDVAQPDPALDTSIASLHTVTNIAPDAAVDTYMTDDRQDLSVQTADSTIAVEVTSEQGLSVQQEPTLVRSALRSSLGVEDAELLNNFLSKAKAARAAKAAAMTMQDVPTEQACQEVSDVPTPQARRALEELDANSPSPSKVQLSPVKASDPADSPGRDDQSRKSVDAREDENQASSPVRRSSRHRAAKVVPQTTTPTLRTLTLRRAKGTEFVFLQRTEAQELALATRRNTRHNKGDAVMPKYVLQALAEQSQKTNLEVDDGKATDPGRKRTGAKKYVTWNEERLVQYQGEDSSKRGERKRNDVALSPTVKGIDKQKAASNRSTRSQTAKTGDDEEVAASTTAPATAAPKARRVRRLGGTKSNSSLVAAADTKKASLLPTLSTGSNVEKRKKLIPKRPSAVATGTPVSNKILPCGTSDDRSSSDSTSGSAPRIRSKNILKAHAGSTPMPRRIRPRP
ncbi:hypothetical protein IFM58399_00174 [Aspergillus lentulus]|uniref:Uncharacterized protein n=1 Tax=Aspergillus lentulus TaxID=293939 RepID=A0AAN6BK70_ASPLE|nr:uncharacterized protein IFM58399_00174 [Aspergillus lentulus]KAF4151879.1 hypothetical protein CNMCM6069_002955 [Aspergillus lentulus]KAF4169598.1 hypothetical protein CNMCM6936_007581 [Aspergillus lentulus]KAF4175155.1 hypothetical protein CNMCM8060_007753 [Aspergillus lentulus]KAF4178090.1 hypothetical protein CNMCM7927_002736 [Aspergillus lentulus]KAF4195307.1 hypothetical protein CNMCM8694_006493 [Aspergillus lentulus]